MWLIVFFIVLAISNSCVNYNNKADYYLNALAGPGKKRAALEWMGLLKDPRAIPYIVKILKQEEEKDSETLTALLSNPGREEQYLVKIDALECLFKIGHPDGVIPIIELSLNNERNDILWDFDFESLRYSDPNWKKRSDVKSYIPNCKFQLKKILEAKTNKSYSGYLFIVKFLNAVDHQNAVPFDIEIIKNYSKFDPETRHAAIKNLNSEDIINNFNIIMQIVFCPDNHTSDIKNYRQTMNKLYPGWDKTSIFKENLLLTSKRIETGKSIEDKIDAINTVKLLNPSSLVPILEHIIFDKKAEEELKIHAIKTLREIFPQKHSDLLISSLKNKVLKINQDLMYELGESGNKKVIPYLMDALEIKDGLLQEAAIFALIKLNARETIAPLVKLSKNQEDTYLVRLIVLALSCINPNPPVKEIMEICLNYHRKENEMDESGTYYRLLSNVNNPVSIGYIIDLYWKLPSQNPFYYYNDEKYLLLKKLSRYNDKRLLPIFKKELGNPKIRMRAFAEYGIFNASR